MISTILVALWLVALTVFPQTTQSCNGDCHDGYRSVCVQRGPNCKCSCIKDVAAGATALRELLSSYNVSAATINEAEERYKEIASRTTEEFSFTVYDLNTGDWIIRGQGLAGTSNGVVAGILSAVAFSNANATQSLNQSRILSAVSVSNANATQSANQSRILSAVSVSNANATQSVNPSRQRKKAKTSKKKQKIRKRTNRQSP